MRILPDLVALDEVDGRTSRARLSDSDAVLIGIGLRGSVNLNAFFSDRAPRAEETRPMMPARSEQRLSEFIGSPACRLLLDHPRQSSYCPAIYSRAAKLISGSRA